MKNRIMMFIGVLIAVTVLVIGESIAQQQQQTASTRSRPDFTDVGVGMLISNGARRLSEEMWFDKVQGPVSYFIQNALTDTLREPYPEGAFSTPETSIPVDWTCDPRIRGAWDRTVRTAPAVVAGFMDAMAVYAATVRSSETTIDCQIIGLQKPLADGPSSTKRFTNVTVERVPEEKPTVIKITLTYE
jgi:hypothetical protein